MTSSSRMLPPAPAPYIRSLLLSFLIPPRPHHCESATIAATDLHLSALVDGCEPQNREVQLFTVERLVHCCVALDKGYDYGFKLVRGLHMLSDDDPRTASAREQAQQMQVG